MKATSNDSKSEFRSLGKSDLLPNNYVNPYYLEDLKRRVSVARVGGALYAFDDLCTQDSVPLSAGLLTGTTLMCQCDGSQFDIATFPCKERACMPGSPTTPSRPSACASALSRLAFRYTDSVGTREQFSIAAQWLACTYPCRRFADTLADACARLGADVVRYSFIAGDLHPLLLAGLPAHVCQNAVLSRVVEDFSHLTVVRLTPRITAYHQTAFLADLREDHSHR